MFCSTDVHTFVLCVYQILSSIFGKRMRQKIIHTEYIWIESVFPVYFYTYTRTNNIVTYKKHEDTDDNVTTDTRHPIIIIIYRHKHPGDYSLVWIFLYTPVIYNTGSQMVYNIATCCLILSVVVTIGWIAKEEKKENNLFGLHLK